MRNCLLVAILFFAPVVSFGAGDEVKTPSEAATNLLMSSIGNLDLKGVQIAIGQGADPNIGDMQPRGKRHPITEAISHIALRPDKREKEKAKVILDYLFLKGGKISGNTDDLYLAILTKDQKLFSVLLERGLNPHKKAYGYSSLELAYLHKADGLIPLLKKRNVPEIDPEYKSTMRIMRALTTHDNEELKTILNEKVNINVYDSRGRTPLIEALNWSSWVMDPMPYLLLTGSAPDFNLNSRYIEDIGNYPLHFLARTLDLRRGEDDFVASVIKEAVQRYQADPNVKNNLSETPLHYAASRKSPQIVKTLLHVGANPLAEDFKGRRPSIAAKNQEIRDLLLEAERSAQTSKKPK